MARKRATEQISAPASETENGATTTETAPTSTRRTRRPRQQTRRTGSRKSAISGTAAVVEALLKSRGTVGATQKDLERAVSWAQQVQAEGEAIEQESVPRRAPRGTGQASSRAKAAAQRQRQQQQEALRDRRNRYELDRALLEGILAGRVTLDVQNDQLLFLDAGAGQTPAPAATSPLVEAVVASEAY